MKESINKVLRTRKFVVTELLIKIALEKKLSLNEFLILIYLDNNYSNVFDLPLMSNVLNLDEQNCMEAFNQLMIKKLVSLEVGKDIDGRTNDIVSLSGIYNDIEDITIEELKEEKKEDIFTIFERELGRTISSYEIELINGWLTIGNKEELVLCALKEAIYNGTTNFRYIDAIIHEWTKKGLKTSEDVSKYLTSRREKKDKQTDLFEYNWLDDDE